MSRPTELLDALERHGYRPVRVGPERWLALCPCCNQLDLVIGRNGTQDTPVTDAERDVWLDHWSRR